MPDKAFKKELDNLSVGCMYRKDKQCPWIGFLRDYQLHLDEIHIHHICPECNERFPSKQALDDHLKICPEIFQACPLGPFCTEEMVKISILFFFVNKLPHCLYLRSVKQNLQIIYEVKTIKKLLLNF